VLHVAIYSQPNNSCDRLLAGGRQRNTRIERSKKLRCLFGTSLTRCSTWPRDRTDHPSRPAFAGPPQPPALLVRYEARHQFGSKLQGVQSTSDGRQSLTQSAPPCEDFRESTSWCRLCSLHYDIYTHLPTLHCGCWKPLSLLALLFSHKRENALHGRLLLRYFINSAMMVCIRTGAI